jgi:hypothetical protein
MQITLVDFSLLAAYIPRWSAAGNEAHGLGLFAVELFLGTGQHCYSKGFLAMKSLYHIYVVVALSPYLS